MVERDWRILREDFAIDLYKRQEILGQAVEILSFLLLSLVYLCIFSFCLWITMCTGKY